MRCLLLGHSLINNNVSWFYFWIPSKEKLFNGIKSHSLSNLMEIRLFKDKRSKSRRFYNKMFDTRHLIFSKISKNFAKG